MNYNSFIEEVLSDYKEKIGIDFDRYRNHVYRVFYLAQLDSTPSSVNTDKFAIAAVFHDIGIWTHETFDYLDPSIELVKKYLDKKGLGKWKEEIVLMINMHHKMSKYKGKYAITVEAFRQADWIDLSFGLMNFGENRKEIRKINTNFPSHGFHRFLIRKSLRYFISHPLNPLPMFKK